MNSDTVGSFPIMCRLLRALRKTTASPAAQSATLQAFLERYSTNPKDLSILFQLLLAEVDELFSPITTLASTSTSINKGIMSPSVWSDAVVLQLLQKKGPPVLVTETTPSTMTALNTTTTTAAAVPQAAAEVLVFALYELWFRYVTRGV